ncbi:PepSY-associated TM helix domain-containing protein [Hephaestia sp. GCM10023244]|uniref:PepSY-associated TM helix domain-containing protein n=1 Tax=unclassified Hephaestia TaxID=2631281 RepID=UPI00207775A0|nr:PepSY-associated TM helix domain-containing protein [Hephaestia sp. MAHUQ-44]MCM8729924.1 PepSY domain-containing protein [Hephaestia sp. MAHUQ-44]
MKKPAWRRTWFQVHKWIGLILAILIIPICLTGSALVWKGATDRIANPQRYATSGATMLPAERYATAAQDVLAEGERITGITMPEGSGPVMVTASLASKGPPRGRPVRKMIYLDPPTATVLDTARSDTGVLRVLHVLHGTLMVPGFGRKLVGWVGVIMMVSAFTGIWLWWPMVGRWSKGLRWRRHANLDTNLHHMAGFWISIPLFVLSLTGAWISFPAFFGALTGAEPRSGPPGRAAAPAAIDPQSSLAEAIAVAGARVPGAVRDVRWPTGSEARWTVMIGTKEVAVDDASGAVAKVSTPRPRGGSGVAGWMRRIHDGTGTGMVWQVIIFLGGLLPAGLAVTGIIMWWRARTWRARLAAKRNAIA